MNDEDAAGTPADQHEVDSDGGAGAERAPGLHARTGRWLNPSDPTAWTPPPPPAIPLVAADPDSINFAPPVGGPVPPASPSPAWLERDAYVGPYQSPARSPRSRMAAIVSGIVAALVVFAIVAALVGRSGVRSSSSRTTERERVSTSTTGETATTVAPVKPAPARVIAALPLAEAQAKTVSAKTAKTRYTMTMSNLPGTDGPVTMTGEGAVDFEHMAQVLTIDMSSIFGQLPADRQPPTGTDLRMEMRQTATAVYMRMPALAEQRPDLAGKWLKLDLAAAAKEAGVDISALMGGDSTSQDPSSVMSMLGGAGADVKPAGTEVVDGVSMTRYVGNIDINNALAQRNLPAADADKLRKVIASSGLAKLPIDALVDGEGHVRRVKMEMTMAGVQLAYTIDFFDFGTPVDFAVPDDGDTVDIAAIMPAATKR